MEKQQLLRADYLDILYDNRNKSYGGYELRKNYQTRARRAATIVVLAAGLLSSIPVIAGILAGNAPKTKLVELTHVIDMADPDLIKKPEPVKPPVRQNTAPAHAPTVAVLTPKIVETAQVPDDAPKPVDSLGDRLIGLHDNDGQPDGIAPDDGQPKGTGSGLDGPAGPAGGLAKPEILVSVSQMPQFDGDVAAYLNSHLRYPEQARIAGQTGRTIIKFVVNEDGAITNTEVARSSKVPSLDAEALRVVSGMPKWKPGKQQGTPVKVYFNLPITFELE